MKKLLSFFVVCSMVLATSSAYATTWKLAHRFSIGSPEDISANFFADRVEELTNGDLKVTIFPSGQLGDWTVVAERVSLGVVEMTLSSQSSQADKRIGIYYFPALFKTLEEAKLNMSEGHPFRTEVDKLLIGQNLYPLAQLPGFLGGIGMKRLPENWADIEADKKMKVRCASDAVLVETATMQNYLATTIPFSDTYPSLQTGVVEAVFGTGLLGNYENFRDVIKYYVPNHDHFEFYSLVINNDLWQGLDPELKDKVKQAATETQERHYKNFHAEEAKIAKLLEDSGVEIIDVPQEHIDALAKKAKEYAWPKLAKIIDEEYINTTLKLLEYPSSK